MAKNKLISFLMAISFALPLLLKAQSPTVDPNWQKNTTYSDEFKYDSGGGPYSRGISTSKWYRMYYAEPTGYNVGGAADNGGATDFDSTYAYDSASVSSGNGFLKLAADGTLNSHYGSWTCSSQCPGTVSCPCESIQCWNRCQLY